MWVVYKLKQTLHELVFKIFNNEVDYCFGNCIEWVGC